MKTRFTLILLALAALTLSCAKEMNNEPIPEGKKVTVRVTIPEAVTSKVALTEAADHKSIALAWEETDAISINGENFTIKSGFTAHEAEFEGTEPAGDSYTIIYPGKYASQEALAARSYTDQEQTGNSSTAHLEYNAALIGVSEYAAPKFDPDWAANKGGTLLQNATLQMRLQLPSEATTATSVSLIASRAIFPTTNAGDVLSKELTLKLKDITLPSNKILEAFMMISSAGVTIQNGDQLTIAVETPEGIFLRTIDLQAQTWTGGGQYTLQLKVQDENTFEINTVDDLLEFRDGVNSGDMIWAKVHAVLKADLDLSSISSWTPIGNGTFINANPYTVSGNTFRGVFDGGNHVLKNFKLNGAPAANAPYGFFGILDGATVKNLVFGAASGDSGYFKITPSDITEAGLVAGLSRGATIKDVTNYSPMSIPENTTTAVAYFGMVGYVLGTAAGRSHLDNVDNYGEVNAHPGNNTANSASGIHVAGIAGFGNTTSSSVKNLIENCDNYGDLTTGTGRVAGILAAANTRTILSNCVNRGNILNTCANGRIAGVCVIIGDGGSMADCSNYGNVVVTKSDTHVGGLVCLINKDNITVSGGGNHGLIVGDRTDYRGTLIANINTFSSMSGMVAGGAVAAYNGGDYQYIVLTEDNYMNYIGKIKSGAESKVTNITFEAWDGYPEVDAINISNAAELLAFAAKVNAGEFGSTDKAVLLNDIDCSSITDWTPIGDYTMSSWSHVNLTGSGHPFLGTFDGKNHSIKNLALSLTNSGSYNALGFFGCIGDGAVVKDLTFDSSCSMTISASYGGAFGMLAGMVLGAQVSNVKNYAPVTGGGTSSLANGANGRASIGALIGEVHPSGTAANISNLYNAGKIGTSESSLFTSGGTNVQTGANAVQVGGIIGFTTNLNNTTMVNVTGCVNDGDIFSNCGRVSGIVAAANRYTSLKNCTNNGNVYFAFNGAARPGNITCIAGQGSVLDGCINTGNLIAPDNVSVSGVVCLVNHASVQIKNCGSHGATIVGKSVNLSGNQTYNGVLFGYCNFDATFSNCSVSGKIGTSLDNLVTLTADNYFPFVGQYTTNATSVTSDNITFYTE